MLLFTEYELWPQNELDLFVLNEIPETLYRDTVDKGKKYINNDWGMLTASMYTDSQHDAFVDIYKERRTK